MKTIAVSKLRSNLMQILEQIEGGLEITITSRGKEIARLIPLKNSKQKARESLEKIRKTAIVNDVLSPINEEWEAMK